MDVLSDINKSFVVVVIKNKSAKFYESIKSISKHPENYQLKSTFSDYNTDGVVYVISIFNFFVPSEADDDDDDEKLSDADDDERIIPLNNLS